MDNVNYDKYEKQEIVQKYVQKLEGVLEEHAKKFEKLQEEVETDLQPIDKTELVSETNKNIALYQRWITMLSKYKMTLMQYDAKLQNMEGELFDFYRFHWDRSTKLTETAIARYVYAHPCYSALNNLVKLVKIVISYLESVVQNFNNRNFAIKNIIEVRKMELGIN